MLALIGMVSAAPAVELTRNHLTANQWVRPTADGELVGRLVLPTENGAAQAVKNAALALTDADGKTLTTQTDDSGRFKISDVRPGVFALTARGEGVFACVAMHLIDPKADDADMFAGEAEIAVASIDYSLVKMAVVRYLPPATKASALSITEADLNKLSPRVNGEDYSRVAQDDGGLTGQISLAGATGGNLAGAGGTNVFVIRNGAEVARTVTDQDGKFRIEKLSPGEYALLAVGAGGMGLTGFELIDENLITKTAMTPNENGYTFVTAFGDACCCCPQFEIQCAPMPEVVTCVEEVIVCDPQPIAQEVIISDEVVGEQIIGEEIVTDGFGTPLAGGGYGGYAGGGGFSGGGGGGFGGGGLGGIAALAGIGGVIAAIASDDDNGGGGTIIREVPVPVSPFSP